MRICINEMEEIGVFYGLEEVKRKHSWLSWEYRAAHGLRLNTNCLTLGWLVVHGLSWRRLSFSWIGRQHLWLGLDCLDASCTGWAQRCSLADAAATDLLGSATAFTLPNTLDTLFILLLGFFLLGWILGRICLFWGLSFYWFLLFILWHLVDHDLLGLFFDRNRLCLFSLLLFLKCVCCWLCLPPLIIICSDFFISQNEPTHRVGYGIPDKLLLLLSETI